MAVSNGKYKQGSLSALELESGDEYSTFGGFTNNVSFAIIGSLTFTPSSQGDYIIFVSGEVDMSSTAGRGQIQLLHTNTSTVYSLEKIQVLNINDKRPWVGMFKINLTAVSHTFQVQMKVNNTAYVITIENTSPIVALRADGFENIYYAEDQTQQFANSSSYIDVVTLTQTPSNGSYMVLANSICWSNSTTSACQIQFDDGGAEVNELIYEPVTGFLGFDSAPFFWIAKLHYPASSHTWKLKQRRFKGAAGISNMKYSAICLLQLDRDDTTVHIKGAHIEGGHIK